MQSPAGDACRELSLVKPIGYQPGDCGYCKNEVSSQRSPNSRASIFIASKSLCPRHYQTLADRGWRRSGTIFYLPDVVRSCCPHYTIRLPVASFKPGRDQRQALYRWNRFVLGADYANELDKKNPKTRAEKKKASNTFDLIHSVHESEFSHIASDLKPAHNFTVTLEPDTFSDEKFALFQNYQVHVHHESPSEVTAAGFRCFLCSSPLHRHDAAPNKPLGSYHQTYRLDGRLIALAVLDLLPHAVSGVYFIYHSDFAAHSLGKVSALREAALASEGGYAYYYMGYYIHSCKKMRYKAEYRPQSVLDLYDYSWNEMDNEMRKLMDERRYASPSQERQEGGVEAEGTETPQELMGVMMQSGRSVLDFPTPGVMAVEDVVAETDLDTIMVSIGRNGAVHQTQELASWDEGSPNDPGSLKGIITEIVGCIGAEVAKEVAIDFSRGS